LRATESARSPVLAAPEHAAMSRTLVSEEQQQFAILSSFGRYLRDLVLVQDPADALDGADRGQGRRPRNACTQDLHLHRVLGQLFGNIAKDGRFVNPIRLALEVGLAYRSAIARRLRIGNLVAAPDGAFYVRVEDEPTGPVCTCSASGDPPATYVYAREGVLRVTDSEGIPRHVDAAGYNSFRFGVWKGQPAVTAAGLEYGAGEAVDLVALRGGLRIQGHDAPQR
jgi:hypothetical protein